jgi:putative endonuclease
MDPRTLFGRAGEAAAAHFYESRGFVVVDRNYRCSLGEIDLVLRRGRLIVFCEVKARRSARWGVPAEAVNYQKQARLKRLAGHWLGQRRPGAVEVRFDVVSVIELTHIPNAF